MCLFYRWWNWGSQRGSDLPEDGSLLNGRAGLQTHISWCQRYAD
jgi:hypothetical protein